eukprot:CAMPEP_0119088942 /NCGR_PEP_ID=MMETSP1178-20130426/147235_1 /TAXON_ID=33656 /ORGANISM="unid sp, Strain CCMP2000" /LENGTH=76 /DNA_ID=CAMNT_0007072259 /DNA_START=15 /DNA_END=241 /DNA_ORIENTATION=+
MGHGRITTEFELVKRKKVARGCLISDAAGRHLCSGTLAEREVVGPATLRRRSALGIAALLQRSRDGLEDSVNQHAL